MDALVEFSDRLPPLLVRELRRSLRSQVFTGLILVTLSLLTVLTLVEKPDGAGGFFIPALYLVVVLLGIPAAALGDIREERAGRRLEPLALAGVGGRSLVWSLLLGHALRIGLIATLAAPFLFADYFLGGREPVENAVTLLVGAAGGITATAWCLLTGLLRGSGNGLRSILVLAGWAYVYLTMALPFLVMACFIPVWWGVLLALAGLAVATLIAVALTGQGLSPLPAGDPLALNQLFKK